jgi:hypothetical protein
MRANTASALPRMLCERSILKSSGLAATYARNAATSTKRPSNTSVEVDM